MLLKLRFVHRNIPWLLTTSYCSLPDKTVTVAKRMRKQWRVNDNGNEQETQLSTVNI